MDEVSIDAQVINVLIYYGGRRPWLLSAVYVSPDITIRAWLWEYLTDMSYICSRLSLVDTWRFQSGCK